MRIQWLSMRFWHAFGNQIYHGRRRNLGKSSVRSKVGDFA
jgi:hypothetical protein